MVLRSGNEGAAGTGNAEAKVQSSSPEFEAGAAVEFDAGAGARPPRPRRVEDGAAAGLLPEGPREC